MPTKTNWKMNYTEAKAMLDKMREAYKEKYGVEIYNQMYAGMSQMILIEFMVGLIEHDRLIKLIEAETK